MRIYTQRKGGTTFGMGAPELRRKIVANANAHGIPITLKFLQQFTHTDFLYGAMRAIAKGRTSHPIIRQWFEEHTPEEERKKKVQQMALAI